MALLTSSMEFGFHIYWGVLVSALAILSLLLYHRSAKLRRRLSDIERELQAVRSAPQTMEFHIERYDALWFPRVTFLPQSHQITQVASGLPYCKSCVSPLSASKGRGDWICAGCSGRYAASLGDFTVADSIAKTALQYFQQRHPGYTAALRSREV